MAFVVTLEGVVPPERDDDLPWTIARVEEATDPAGTWTQISSIVLSPVDTTPESPQPRTFTVETATLSAGWYRVKFVDASGDVSAPTSPVGGTSVNYVPSRRDVGSLLRARTRAPMDEIGTFNDQTRPTGEAADVIIFRATRDVASSIGITVATDLIEDARTVATYLSCALVELSYYPEQINENMSGYEKYIALYKSALLALKTKIDADAGTGPVVAGTVFKPSFSYPDDTGMIGLNTQT